MLSPNRLLLATHPSSSCTLHSVNGSAATLRLSHCLTSQIHRISFLSFFFFLHFHQEPPLAQRSVYPTLNPHPNNNPLLAQVQSAQLHSTPERQRSTRTDFCVNLLPFSCTAEGKRPGFLFRSYEFFMRRIIFSLFIFSPHPTSRCEFHPFTPDHAVRNQFQKLEKW